MLICASRFMLRTLGLVLVLAYLCSPSFAAERGTLWVEATGFASVSGSINRDTARRQALADALFTASLAGGADINGHTVTSMGKVVSDLTLMQPRKRILKYSIVDSSFQSGTWRITLKALVGPADQGPCHRRRILSLTAYAPIIRVSHEVPAWVLPLADTLAAAMVSALDNRPETNVRLATGQARLAGQRSTLPDSFDFTALTVGKVRTAKGDLAFQTEIAFAMEARGKRLRLDMDIKFYRGQSRTPVASQRVTNVVPIRGIGPLHGLRELTRPKRAATIRKLTKNSDKALKTIIVGLACSPLAATVHVSNGQITVPVGRRHGIRPGSLAYTTDTAGKYTLFDIVSLGDTRSVLRPLGSDQLAKEFDKRSIQFLETGK